MTALNRTRLAAATAVAAALCLIGWVEVRLWNAGSHELRVAVAWSVAAVVGTLGAGIDRWRLSRASGRSVPLALIVADAVVAVAGFATLLVMPFGGAAGAYLAVGAGVPVTALVWWARRRIVRGRWDGGALLTTLLLFAGYLAAQRPWTPRSAQWVSLAVIAFVAAAAVAFSTARLHLRVAREQQLLGAG